MTKEIFEKIFDSMWEDRKDAESVANKFEHFQIPTSISARKSTPGWEVYIDSRVASDTKKNIRLAAKQKFPEARSLTVIFRHGNVYLQVNTKKVYRVIKSKASLTGFRFVSQ